MDARCLTAARLCLMICDRGSSNLNILADPTVGEIRIGGNEAVVAGLLATVYERLRRRYPRIAIHVTQVPVVSQQIRELRERKSISSLGASANRSKPTLRRKFCFTTAHLSLPARKTNGVAVERSSLPIWPTTLGRFHHPTHSLDR